MGAQCVSLPVAGNPLPLQAAGTSNNNPVAGVAVTMDLYPAAALAVGTGQMGILPGPWELLRLRYD